MHATPRETQSFSTVRGLLIAGAVSAAVLVVALVGLSLAGWAAAPITLRFLVGLIVFGVSPGVLLCGPFFSRADSRISAGDLIVSIITCSFSCNLAFNIVLFWLHRSMADLTYAYVVLQLAGYLAWLGWVLVKRPLPARADADTAAATPRTPASWTTRLSWGVIALAAGSAIYIAYAHGAPITNSEEMVVLRKLVENPAVRYDNLSYRDGDPSTYLFVPFQILIAGTSVIAKIDVSIVYSMFFAVSTALSMFVIAMLVHALTGSVAVTALATVWMLGIALFDPGSVIYGSGIIAAFPNRYGFAGGVLLPLILLLFWSVLREPRFRFWRWGLLVYVAVEMTFVHARETLLALGAMMAVFVALVVHWRQHRSAILRIMVVVVLTGLVLAGYKRVNLALSPELDAYVGAVSAACRTALKQLLSDHGPLDLIGIGPPRGMNVAVNGSEPITIGFVTYRSMFVDPWQYGFLGRLYLPLVLLILPVYVMTARSLAEISLAIVLTALAVITSSGLLNILISAIVGSPEVLIVYNIVALFSVLVLITAVWNLSVALCRRLSEGGRLQLWSSGTPDRPRSMLFDITTSDFIVLGSVALLLVAFQFSNVVDSWRPALHAMWSDRFATVLLGLTLLAIVVRLRFWSLPLLAAAEVHPPRAPVVAIAILGVILMPAMVRSDFWTKPFTPPFPSQAFTGDFTTDYPHLIDPQSKKLDPTPYPLPIIRYLREQVPPNQTLVASDALALLERVPHFVPFLSNKGEVAPHFIVNTTYLRDFSMTGPSYALAPFLENAATADRFRVMLEQFQVDYVVVDPSEAPEFARAIGALAVVRQTITEVFSNEGFVIYRVTAGGSSGQL